MKALLSRTCGGPETLEMGELPEPVAAPGRLVVDVRAVSLNYPDALMIEDLYQTRPPRPFAPGSECAGVVTAVGEGVSGFAVGDRVAAICGHGALAERVATAAALTVRLPDAVPFDIGATIMMTYGTTIHALLDRVRLKPGERLLVLGASGGIGMAAVELGKALGARVVAGVSSPEKAAAVRAAGADAVVVYPRGRLDRAAARALTDQFKAACPEGFDVIYDPVGGDYAEAALRAIAWEGRYAVIGFTAGIPQLPLNPTLLKCCAVVGVFWGVWAGRNRERLVEEMAMLFGWLAEGKIRPPISRRFTLETAPAALALMQARGAIGKLVVEM